MNAELSNTDMGLLIAGSIVIPWLVFMTKAMLALRTKQDNIHHDVKWIRREHEPEQGVQAWKNPGLVDAVDKLGGHLDTFGTVLRDIQHAVEKK